jgi:hypothetical protein
VAETRTPELVRRDIAAERRGLTEAVEELRQRVGDVTDVKRQIGSRRRLLAPAAFATTFVVSGGIGATMRYLARRGREHR